MGEDLLRRRTGVAVVRCRIDESTVRIEAPLDLVDRIDQTTLDSVLATMQLLEPQLARIEVDPRGYRPGRALEITVKA
jgi:uncharacterized protein